MLQRLVAGLVGLAIVLPILIYGGPNSAFWLIIPFLLIGLDEYAKMALPDQPRWQWGFYLVAGLALYLVGARSPEHLGVALPIALALAMVLPMFGQTEVEKGATHALRLGFGLVYVPVLLAPLAIIRQAPDGLALIFLVMASTWLGDTGAYFAGRAFGKTPLFPRVSPKKTWEGVIGGVVLSMIGACVVKVVGDPDLSWPAIVLLAAAIDIAGVLGDLAESMLKRAFGVKDSGWIMPGHGGILDRIDSLLFSAPILWLALQARPLLAG